MTQADWIAVDWGTSNLRVWAMSDSGTVLDAAQSNKGMSGLTPDAFEPALKELVDPWVSAKTPVIACGMVGSRQGWVEAAYDIVPCPVTVQQLARPAVKDPNLDVRIIPGIRQMDPADVMRGEETQIAGFLALNTGWDGVICLPGTHTKWVHISAGEVVSFQTFMTGELFGLLSKHSVLRHSLSDDLNPAGFNRGLDEALSRPATLAARLFSLRAESLVGEQDPADATGRLSGLLIGAELAGAKPYLLISRSTDILVEKPTTIASVFVLAFTTSTEEPQHNAFEVVFGVVPSQESEYLTSFFG